MKTCSKCHIEKDESEFTKGRNRCGDCSKKYHQKYWATNKKELNNKQSQYYLANKDKCKERNKAWYKKSREGVLKKKRVYPKKNQLDKKEYMKEYRKLYTINNKEKINAKKRECVEKRKDYYREVTKKNLAKGVRELGNRYINSLLKRDGHKKENITEDHIETKKLIIKIKRHVKSKSSQKHP